MATDLSPRQREIADLVIAGLNVPQIAKRLLLSPSTVRAHKQALYMKLGVTSSAEMAKALSE